MGLGVTAQLVERLPSGHSVHSVNSALWYMSGCQHSEGKGQRVRGSKVILSYITDLRLT